MAYVSIKSGDLPNGMTEQSFPLYSPVEWNPQNRKCVFRYWKYLLFACIGFLLFVNVFQNQFDASRWQQQAFFFTETTEAPRPKHNGYLVYTPGCRIPYMDVTNKKIEQYVFDEAKPKCNNNTPPLFEQTSDAIFMVKSSIKYYVKNGAKFSSLACCYTPFFRRNPAKDQSDNKIRFSGTCIPFVNRTTIRDEFINVNCYMKKKLVYEDYFAFVPIKQEIQNLTRTNKNILNTLVIGIDSVSRLNLHRQMPETVKLLNKLNAIELLGYNKVGDNTYPNLVPVLSGLSQTELQDKCWQSSDMYFDECPFIWYDFKDKGFVTSFGEDAAWMGIFNYMRRGFMQQPTDYMWGPFNYISEQKIGNSHKMNVYECVGARRVYQVFLQYIGLFAKSMAQHRLPYFAFFWTASLTHDLFNMPKLGDLDYMNLLNFLYSNDYMSDTALIFMSDHGIRWGDFRGTYQGLVEERLPFVYVILPKWYQKQYKHLYKNLQANALKLTTPYDLHETIKDLMVDPNQLTEQLISERSGRVQRAYSLFDNISPERTCNSSGINNHWCTCQESEDVDVNSTVVVDCAKFAVDHLNKQLIGYAQCAKLKLSSVTEARLITHTNEELTNQQKSIEYIITLITLPGEGLFQVTVRTAKNEKKTKKRKMEVVGSVSRLNLYGKQSDCITEFHLKKYCYCTNIIWS